MIAIGSKFVGPNSHYNESTKEYWSVLPQLSKSEVQLQIRLLRNPPPKREPQSRVEPGAMSIAKALRTCFDNEALAEMAPPGYKDRFLKVV